MLHRILTTLLFLESLQSGMAFVSLHQRHAVASTTTALERTPTFLFASPLFTVALPPPVSISMGPLHYSWYEDTGNAGFQRQVHYAPYDDDDLLELAYTSFGYDGGVIWTSADLL